MKCNSNSQTDDRRYKNADIDPSKDSLSYIISSSIEARQAINTCFLSQSPNNPIYGEDFIHSQVIHDLSQKKIIITKDHIHGLISLYKDEHWIKNRNLQQKLFHKMQEIFTDTETNISLLKDQNALLIFNLSLLSSNDHHTALSANDYQTPNNELIMELLGSQEFNIEANGILESMGPLAYEAILEEDEDYSEIFDDKKSSSNDLAKEIGAQEYKRITSKMTKLIVNSDLLLPPNQVKALAQQLIQYTVIWGKSGGLAETIILSSLETLFPTKDEKTKGLFNVRIENKTKRTAQCHFGVKKWNNDYFGLGMALEIELEFGIRCIDPSDHRREIDLSECEKYCTVECKLVQNLSLPFYDCYHSISKDDIFVDAMDTLDGCMKFTDKIQNGYIILRLYSALVESKSKRRSSQNQDVSCHEKSCTTPNQSYVDTSKDKNKACDVSSSATKPISTVINNDTDKIISDPTYVLDTSVGAFAWGDNDFNCLGLLPHASKPKPIQIEPHIVNIPYLPAFDHIMTVSCSSCHTLILTVLGCIFACGDGSDGQLGHGSLDSSHYFQQIEYFSNPNTVNGENGNQEKKQKYPTFISQISAGADEFGGHSAAIDCEGKLYTWGKATSCGHVGYGDIEMLNRDGHSNKRNSKMKRNPNILYPRKVSSFKKGYKALKVSCGGSFTLAIVQNEGNLNDVDASEKNRSVSVYSWGLHNNGRLGHGKHESSNYKKGKNSNAPLYQLRPRKIITFEGKNIKEVCAGHSHALALSNKGEIYAWGSNSSGQSGLVAFDFVQTKIATEIRTGARTKGIQIPRHPSVFDDVWIPRAIPFSGYDRIQLHKPSASSTIEILKIEAGKFHSAAIDSNGQLWTWGGGGIYESCLGHGYSNSLDAIPSSKNIILSAMEKCKLSGNLKSPDWGTPRLVQALNGKEITEVSLGDIHCGVVTKCGKVYLWGDGVAVARMHQVEENEEVENMVMHGSGMPLPYQPNDLWLPQLAGVNVIGLFCGGQHAFALTNGSRIKCLLGQILLRECHLYSRKTIEDIDYDSEELHVTNMNSISAVQPDCAVIASGKRLYCHKFILSHRCPILHQMIIKQERPRPQSDIEINPIMELFLPNTRFDVAKVVIRFLYTDHLLVGSNRNYQINEQVSNWTSTLKSVPSMVFVQEVFRAAEEFGLIRLMKLSQKIIDYYSYLSEERFIDKTEIDNSHLNFDIEGQSEKQITAFQSDFMPSFSLNEQPENHINTAHTFFEVAGKIIPVHTCILVSCSTYFRKLLSPNKERTASFSLDSQPISIEFSCSYDALIRFVYYLYTRTLVYSRDTNTVKSRNKKIDVTDIDINRKYHNSVEKQLDMVVEDIKNATFFQVLDMKYDCESLIMDMLMTKTTAKVSKNKLESIFSLALDVNASCLKEYILYMLSHHLNDGTCYQQLNLISAQYPHVMSDIFERIKERESFRTSGGKSIKKIDDDVTIMKHIAQIYYGYDLMIPIEFQHDYEEVEMCKQLKKQKRREKIVADMMGTHCLNFDFDGDHFRLLQKDRNLWAFMKSVVICFLKSSGGRIMATVILYTFLQYNFNLGLLLPFFNLLIFGLCLGSMISGL